MELDRSGVPVLSADDIESKAESVLRWFDPSLLREPRSVDVEAIVKQLDSKAHLRFIDFEEIPRSNDGGRRRGTYSIRTCELWSTRDFVVSSGER